MRIALIVICVIILVSFMGFFAGYKLGYSKYEAEINRELIRSHQLQIDSTNKLSQQIKKEKELLLKIKENNVDCEKVLNFNLRSCFK